MLRVTNRSCQNAIINPQGVLKYRRYYLCLWFTTSLFSILRPTLRRSCWVVIIPQIVTGGLICGRR